MPKIVAVDTDFEDNAIEARMAAEAGVDFEPVHGHDVDDVVASPNRVPMAPSPRILCSRVRYLKPART